MQGRQTRTINNNTPIKKRLKKRIGFGSRNTNTRNTKNGTIVEKAHLLRDLDYNTQKLAMCLIHFNEINSCA
jgi:hypothetical protein